MQELDAKLKWLLAWELATYLGELKAGGSPEFLAPLVGSKPQKEDKGDIDEDRSHLYDRIKMLYEEDYELEPVLTHRTEDAISVVISPLLASSMNYPTHNSPASLLMEPPPNVLLFFRIQRTSSSRMRNK